MSWKFLQWIEIKLANNVMTNRSSISSSKCYTSPKSISWFWQFVQTSKNMSEKYLLHFTEKKVHKAKFWAKMRDWSKMKIYEKI